MIQINYIFWLSLAAILSILDLVLGANFFLIILAICSAIIALVTYILPSILWQEQGILFAITAIALLYFWTNYVKRTKQSDKFQLNRRADKFIGRTTTLIEPMVAGYSKIKLDDSLWKVYSDQLLAEGTIVEVIAVNNLILVVKKL